MNPSGFQLFIENLVLTSLSILKIVLLSDVFIQRKKPVISIGQESVILGNGPSLIKSIDDNPEFLPDKDLVCVNLFPLTPYYQKLKPKYFITGAPEFWIDNVSEELKVKRKELFTTIKDQTSWELILLMPSISKRKKEWQNILSGNKHIKIRYYNITPIEGYKWFKHFCFKSGLGLPRPHNVITPSLIQMLNFGYRKIYLLGADHSWLPEITVDSENRVFVCQKHFYDNDSTTSAQMKNLKMEPRKLHEVLHKFYHTFAGYFIIKEYAVSLHAEIYNATPGSFIDAFERRDIGIH